MDGGGDDSQIMLAEYAALRNEVDRRANVQWNVFALQVGSAGAVVSIAISTASHAALSLVIPLTSYMLGSRYILHDFHIKLIHQYIRESLSPRLNDVPQWETWQSAAAAAGARRSRWFTATRWDLFHPTRLPFEGTAALALAAALFAGAYLWRDNAPQWYVIAGLAVVWLLGAMATVLLHGSFNRSATSDVT